MDCPEQRKVVTRFLTPTGWLVGTVHLPADLGSGGLLAHLNRESGFVTLTEVQWPWTQSVLPFLALQRQATSVVVAEEAELEAPEVGSVTHQVSCLLEGGVAMGRLHLPKGERVSDRMTREVGFFPLRACTIALDMKSGMPATETVAMALVNASRLVGVSES